jgi:hypothetical protein
VLFDTCARRASRERRRRHKVPAVHEEDLTFRPFPLNLPSLLAENSGSSSGAARADRLRAGFRPSNRALLRQPRGARDRSWILTL